MSCRFFLVTTSTHYTRQSTPDLHTGIIITPNRHWKPDDIIDEIGFRRSHVVWEKEVKYEDALDFSGILKDDFDNMILKSTTTQGAIYHDA